MSAIRDIEREAAKREREEVIANLLDAAEGIGAFEVLNAVLERAGYSDDIEPRCMNCGSLPGHNDVAVECYECGERWVAVADDIEDE